MRGYESPSLQLGVRETAVISPSSALFTVSPVPSSEVWTSPPNVAIGSTFEPLYLLIMVPFVGLFAIWAWRRCGGKRKTGTVCPGGGQPEKQSVEEDPKTVTTDNPVVQALQQGEDKTTEPVGEINPTPVGNPPVRQQIDRTARLVQMLHSRRRRLPPLPPPEKDDGEQDVHVQKNMPHPSLFILASSEEQDDANEVGPDPNRVDILASTPSDEEATDEISPKPNRIDISANR
ncbi:MAG: hypothetical protein CL450_08950 [Acidimicrobiaceae bacterium]|nr:hypothetical protein [Acidimicrobiaceae bacterium]